MANAAADQKLVDQIDEAFDVFGTRVTVNVGDERIVFNDDQKNSPGTAPLVHTFNVKTTSEALVRALAAAVLAEGRP